MGKVYLCALFSQLSQLRKLRAIVSSYCLKYIGHLAPKVVHHTTDRFLDS